VLRKEENLNGKDFFYLCEMREKIGKFSREKGKQIRGEKRGNEGLEELFWYLLGEGIKSWKFNGQNEFKF
jgi:hypothetical protein